MSENALIEAFVQKLVENEHPIPIDKFKFFVLPRIGEFVHLLDDDKEITLKIVAVDHWAHGPNGNEPYVVTLTGKQID